MNVTFMIGNGFDINCGMKCTYQDAYEGYVNSQSNSEIIKQFKSRISSDYETWADFEVAMASDMVNYKEERDFITCIRDFKKYLNKYLSDEEDTILKQLKNAQVYNAVKREMENSIDTFYEGISHDITREINEIMSKEGVNYRVISFNYTSLFDEILSFLNTSYKKDIIHIHGKLHDDLILGMDNIEQLPQAQYKISQRGERAFIKTLFNRAYDHSRVITAEKMIESSDIICVYGMSLGESDITWRNILFQWLHSSKSVHLFLYNYKCSCMADMTADERLDNEEDAKIHILTEFGVESANIDQYMPQIHIPCGKNIFNIQNAIQKGLNIYERMNTSVQKMNRQAISSVR